MTPVEAIEIIINEKECVKRNAIGKPLCNRDCANCDLVMEDKVIIEAYDMAIEALMKDDK